MPQSRAGRCAFILMVVACLAVIARNLHRHHLQQQLHQAVMEDEGAAVATLMQSGAKDDGKQLLIALRRGNLSAARALFTGEPAPNKDTLNRALARAVSMRQIEMARLLLDKGASPDTRYDNADSMSSGDFTTLGANLIGVAINGCRGSDPRSDPLISLLIARGAVLTPEQASLLNRAPLSRANLSAATTRLQFMVAHGGHTETIRELVQQGADVNALDSSRQTPLTIMAADKKMEMLRFMLEHTPRPDTGAALRAAARVGNVEATRLLLSPRYCPGPSMVGAALLDAYQYRSIYTRGIQNTSSRAVVTEAADRFRAVMALLLLQKADFNVQNSGGQTALMFAARSGDTDIAVVLLTKEARVNSVDKQGMTALLWAAEQNHTDLMKILLAHHAVVDIKNRRGATALMSAAWRGNPEAARMLLDGGADVNAANDNGPALTGAVRMSSHETAALLLARGARTDIANRQGKTPWDYALKLSHPGMVALLQKAKDNRKL